MSYYASSPEHVASLVSLVKRKNERALVTISGPPLSGKSYVARKLVRILSPNTLFFEGRYAPLSLGLFISKGARELHERTGMGLYHPDAYDVKHLRDTVEALLSRGTATLNIGEVSDEGVKEKTVRMILPSGGVLVVEGLYSCRFLADVSNLCVYVDVSRKMELIVRRLVRMVYGMSSEESIRLSGVANVAWELFGEEQRKNADVIYLNPYRILEDVGRPSYQFKVCVGKLKAVFPEVAKKILGTTPVEVEDYVVTEWPERLRLRLFKGKDTMEVSYRYYVPEGVPYLRVAKYRLSSKFLPAFLLSLRSSGFRVKVVRRRIAFLEGDVLFKYYPDKNVVEVESSDIDKLAPYLEALRGEILLKSYYTGGMGC